MGVTMAGFTADFVLKMFTEFPIAYDIWRYFLVAVNTIIGQKKIKLHHNTKCQ